MNNLNFLESLPISKILNVEFPRNVTLSESLVKSDQQGINLNDHLRSALKRQKRGYTENIGPHPDFSSLSLEEEDYGHVTSFFVDIKSSTRLGFEYPPVKVKRIKQALIESAIIVIQSFDGHVHRLQGDAVVSFFRRADLDPAVTALDSLNAATTLLALMESYVNPKLVAQGFDPIKIRVGIDHDPNALWSHYGVCGCTEITATGPYVDLAAKLQHKAKSNSIMIGENLRQLLDIPNEFLSIKKVMKKGNLIEERYIYKEQNYKMYAFEWRAYASNCAWLFKSSSGLFSLGESPDGFIPLQAFLYDCNDKFIAELKSSFAIVPKGYKIKFELCEKQMPSRPTSIIWRVENRGDEAKNDNALKCEIEESRDKYKTARDTTYLGHHYLICEVKYQHIGSRSKRFGVWVAEAKNNLLTEQVKELFSMPFVNTALSPSETLKMQ